jgi:hypothetical protein
LGGQPLLLGRAFRIHSGVINPIPARNLAGNFEAAGASQMAGAKKATPKATKALKGSKKIGNAKLMISFK